MILHGDSDGSTRKPTAMKLNAPRFENGVWFSSFCRIRFKLVVFINSLFLIAESLYLQRGSNLQQMMKINS